MRVNASTRPVVISALITAAVVASPASGQSLNIDFGTATFSPTPSASYGAAANSPGTWNQISATVIGVPEALVGLNGSSLVNVAFTHVNDGDPSVNFNDPATSGEIQNLLDDGLDLGAAAASDLFRFTGLTNGQYTVYTYAWAPGQPSYITAVTVQGAPPQLVGGPFPGSLQQGITHAVHTVNVTNGQLDITTATVSGFSTLNGMQLVYIPTPGSLALLAIAAALGRGRRRRT